MNIRKKKGGILVPYPFIEENVNVDLVNNRGDKLQNRYKAIKEDARKNFENKTENLKIAKDDSEELWKKFIWSIEQIKSFFWSAYLILEKFMRIAYRVIKTGLLMVGRIFNGIVEFIKALFINGKGKVLALIIFLVFIGILCIIIFGSLGFFNPKTNSNTDINMNTNTNSLSPMLYFHNMNTTGNTDFLKYFNILGINLNNFYYSNSDYYKKNSVNRDSIETGRYNEITNINTDNKIYSIFTPNNVVLTCNNYLNNINNVPPAIAAKFDFEHKNKIYYNYVPNAEGIYKLNAKEGYYKDKDGTNIQLPPDQQLFESTLTKDKDNNDYYKIK
jgi:hypothetical protein